MIPTPNPTHDPTPTEHQTHTKPHANCGCLSPRTERIASSRTRSHPIRANEFAKRFEWDCIPCRKHTNLE